MNRQTFTLQNRDSLGLMGKAFRKLYIVCGVIKNKSIGSFNPFKFSQKKYS